MHVGYKIIRYDILMCATYVPMEGRMYVVRTYVRLADLKVHKIENFFGSDFEFCVISLLVMLKY
jgi:hypothetical protein